MTPPVIHFDYDFSPYGQKTKLLLASAGIPFVKKDEPIVLPRPDLAALGITYRRIPLLALGKDVYADSAAILHVVLSHCAELGGASPPATSPADKAYETWGNQAFQDALGAMRKLDDGFIKDRETIFPALNRPDLAELRPSALAAVRARLDVVENQFLAGSEGPFIGGKKVAVADVHVFWVLRWLLTTIGVGKEPGLGKEDWPKVYRAIEALPAPEPKVIEFEETKRTITGAQYFAKEIGIIENDATGFKVGDAVNVESLDATPGAHPQKGKLLGLGVDEIVIEVDHGIHLHFPRIGYVLKPLEGSKL